MIHQHHVLINGAAAAAAQPTSSRQVFMSSPSPTSSVGVFIKFGVNTFALKLPIRRQDFGFEAARTRLSTNANDTCTTMTHGGAVLDEKF